MFWNNKEKKVEDAVKKKIVEVIFKYEDGTEDTLSHINDVRFSSIVCKGGKDIYNNISIIQDNTAILRIGDVTYGCKLTGDITLSPTIE
jgi:hypothetical protein